jgi:hypothetical protein
MFILTKEFSEPLFLLEPVPVFMKLLNSEMETKNDTEEKEYLKLLIMSILLLPLL